MEYIDPSDLIGIARGHFINGQYPKAEPLLNQLLLIDNKNPEIFQMLATIYYDRGQFKKAINTFRRALEIDPTYTDASVGLSIILNDLGRYEEGKKIFEDAQKELARNKRKNDPYIEERLASKHIELGDLYFQYARFAEAAEQFLKAAALSARKADAQLKAAEALFKSGDDRRSLKLLRDTVSEYPNFIPAQIRLGQVLFQMNRIIEAIEEWEKVLLKDPSNQEAKQFIAIAQKVDVTEVPRVTIER